MAPQIKLQQVCHWKLGDLRNASWHCMCNMLIFCAQDLVINHVYCTVSNLIQGWLVLWIPMVLCTASKIHKNHRLHKSAISIDHCYYFHSHSLWPAIDPGTANIGPYQRAENNSGWLAAKWLSDWQLLPNCTPSGLHSFVCLFVHLLIHSFVHWFIHSFLQVYFSLYRNGCKMGKSGVV